MYPSLHIHTHILMCSIQNTYYINIFVDIIENREECILSDDCHITSEMFNYDGGELLIKEHSVKITVPIGAIEEGYKVKIFKMNKDTVKYQIQISDTTCTVLSDHFCSKCLAMIANQKPKPARIMMYHYLPENYQDKKDFQAEVSFCPDHTFYKQVRNQLIFLAEYE